MTDFETHPIGTAAALAAAIARAEAAEALVADCAEYLKEGETPRQRMDREHKDVLALMAMLAKDRAERDALRARLAHIVALAARINGAAKAVQDAINAGAEYKEVRALRDNLEDARRESVMAAAILAAGGE